MCAAARAPPSAGGVACWAWQALAGPGRPLLGLLGLAGRLAFFLIN